MSELPKGWSSVAISEIAIYNPKTVAPENTECAFSPMQYLGTNFRSQLGFEVKTWGDIKKAYTHFQNGDVLMAKVTPCFENGKAGIASDLPSGIGAGSSEFMVFRSTEAILNRFLLGWLSTQDFRRRATVAMTGSVGLKRVPKDFVLAEQIPLAPFPEQKRIADKLDATLARVDICRERLARVAPILKRFRQSVLAAATSGRLTADWREQQRHSNAGSDAKKQQCNLCRKDAEWTDEINPASVTQNECSTCQARPNLQSFQTAEDILSKSLAEKAISNPRGYKKTVALEPHPDEILPQGWCWISLDQACLKITDGTHHSPVNLSSGDFMYVTSKNVREGYLDLSSITYVNKETHAEIYARCDVKVQDVLYVKDGVNTGLACVNALEDPISLLSSVGVLRPSSILKPIYLQHYLNSPTGRGKMLGKMLGTAIKRLTIGKIAESPISIPPLAEQTEIVRRVETLFAFADRLEARLASATVAAERLTPSLLAKAFRGELVPQDPNDEPASELLKRLAASRESAGKAPKAKRSRKPAAA
ncbi:restriction endonuclease subunit S [Aquitalea magnusonii]|uniref:Type I restriction enzyme S subunit n=1 Tax=Aquitalea magnusonii TaxID=332411 RepID=A0A318JRG2_9NEIS|nr:restriction endonuclease subunit S [Aquitalea magnusonii]PXX51106.1 type I restriction enzyme S subunit [Aquitalea magnusonii]